MKTTSIPRRFCKFLRAREAVSALEYAILVGVIATGIGAAVTAFNTDLAATIGLIGDEIDTAAEVGVP